MSMQIQEDLTNYMCSPQYKNSGNFNVPSSWNYGSYYPCNPYYNKREQDVEKSSNFVNGNNYNNIDHNHERSNSAGLNQFGKRKLPADEKIVTEDYLQMMKDFKVIKSQTNTSKTSMNRNKSSTQIRTSCNDQDELQGENYQNTQNISQYSNSQSQNKNCVGVNKPFKYQLSYEEWAAVKAKQIEITKKVKIIKESEDQNFEFFNKKINENYKIIQEQNFNEWVQKKQQEKLKQRSRKSKEEESKEIGKIKKQEESQIKMEMWFKRQAELLDSEARNKKLKEDKKKEEIRMKLKEENLKKAKANEAFRFWIKKKEEEKKMGRGSGSFQMTQGTQGTQGTQVTQGTLGSNKNYNSHQGSNTGSTSTKAFSRKQKIPIGPYSNAKDLRKIQQRLLSSSSAGSNNVYSQDQDNIQINQMNHMEDLENQSDYEQDKQEMYSKENIEDSLQELSSIKKDTPAPDQEIPDYD